MQKYLSLPTYVVMGLTWLLCFVLLVGCTSHSPTPVLGSPTATLRVQGNNVLTLLPDSTQAIPANFLGFSIELDQLCNVLQLDAQNPAAYEQLYRNLGSSTLRIGGHTS